MYLLHNIGERRNSNYNTIDEILALDVNAPISFDGLYANVLPWARKLAGRNITIFVCGSHIGKDNSFDAGCGMPNFRVELFADWHQIIDFCRISGANLGWHSWNHTNMCNMGDEDVKFELSTPIPIKYFAYPYGNVDARVAELTKKAGYHEAWSVTQGDGTQFQRNRKYLNW